MDGVSWKNSSYVVVWVSKEMLLLLNQILRSVFQPVITLKKQKCHNNISLKKNDLNQSRAVPKGSNLHTSWTIVRRQSTGWVLTITNKCVTSPLHSGSLTGGRRLIREINQAMFSNLGQKPEVNISHARTVVFTRFSN